MSTNEKVLEEPNPVLDAYEAACMASKLVWTATPEGREAIRSSVVSEEIVGDFTQSTVSCDRCAAACVAFHQQDWDIKSIVKPPRSSAGDLSLNDCTEYPKQR